ncbi:hypothetical protein [Pseudomonas sp. Marseille-QA0892]
MSTLIDNNGARQVASKFVQAQLQEERDRFRAAVNKAQGERAKASDDKQFQGIGPQERMVVVEEGDRLLEIAAATQVDLEAIALANPQLENVDFIRTGEVLFLPPPSPSEIAAQPNGLDTFRDELYQRGSAIEYADAGSTDHQAEIGLLANDTAEFLSALPDGYREIATQHLFDHDWTDAGPAQLAIEQAAEQIGHELKRSTHQGPEIETEVRNILLGLGDQTSPQSALSLLNAAYSASPSDVQRALLKAPESQRIIKDAADWSALPLASVNEPSHGHSLRSLTMAERLDATTLTLDPELRSRFMEHFAPALARGMDTVHQRGDSPEVWLQATETVLNVTKQLDPARDHAAIQDLASTVGLSASTPFVGVREGGSMAYITAVAAQSDKSSVYPVDQALTYILKQQSSEVSSHIQAYQQHLMQVSWLSQNGGTVMTDAQLDEAVSHFTESNSEWSASADELRAQIARDGEMYIGYLSVLEAKYPALFDSDTQHMSEAVERLPTETDRAIAQAYLDQINSPEAMMAMRLAVEDKPGLLDSVGAMQRVAQIGKMTDRGRKLVEELASLYIRSKMLPALRHFDPSNAASRAAVHAQLNALKGSELAKMLGVSQVSLNRAIDAVAATLASPIKGGTASAQPEMFDEAIKKMAGRLNGIRGFQADTPGGMALRQIGVAGAIAGLANSSTLAAQDPNFGNIAKALFDLAGLGQKGIEISAVYSNALANHTIARDYLGSSRLPAAAALGAVTSAFDFYYAKMAAESGDRTAATLYTVSGISGIAAAAGSGYWLGPVGIIVNMGSLYILSEHQRAQHASQYETPETVEFLKHAGFSESAAQTLSNQSREGYSIVPLLARYAAEKGLDVRDEHGQKTFVSWVNDMSPERFDALAGNLRNAIDSHGGNASTFPVSDPAIDGRVKQMLDDRWIDGEKEYMSGNSSVATFVQLDMALDQMDIPQLS